MTVWRDVFESLAEALLLVSPSLELRAANPAAQTMLGISKPTRKVLATFLKNNSWLRRMVESSIAGGQTLSDAEAVLRLPNHNSVEVAVRVSPLIDRKGRIQGAVVLLRDRAFQRGIERALADSVKNGLGLSAAGLAHEIKNPLTAIKGAAELLADLFSDDQRARQYCEVILTGVNRLAGLVEEVMALSGRQVLRRAPLNIHRVLHHALAMAGLWPTAPPGIIVEQSFDPSLPEVEGDEAALERVFLNLIKNAREAIGDSGRIRLTTRMETEFHLTTQGKRRRFMRVEISDSGKGLSREQMAELFTPFFTTKPNGTGLGLVLSKHIVSLHGGRIWAEIGGNEGHLAAAYVGEDEQVVEFKPALNGLTIKVLLPIAQPTVDDSVNRDTEAKAGQSREWSAHGNYADALERDQPSIAATKANEVSGGK